MPPAKSAALLVWRGGAEAIEFLLVHPGGPYWRGRDAGGWSIPKGLLEPREDAAAAARREFAEETGLTVAGDLVPLEPVRQKSGKLIIPFALEADLDLGGFHSNSFEIEWPPRSGRRQAFPEADRARYFRLPTALVKIHAGQAPILIEAAQRLAL